MSIDEIFPNPTVKTVVFQITFPNMFSLENKIGDFQVKILDKFQNSSLLYRRQLLFADVGSDGKYSLPPSELDDGIGKKIWKFTSEDNYALSISTDSLSISSNYHKTYNREPGSSFRDIIVFVLDNFFNTVNVPLINRIGLRYIDECPIFEKTNKDFKEWYNSVFPIKRFKISDADEMTFNARVKKGDFYLRYIEALKKCDDAYTLIIDNDAYANKIKPADYIDVTDKLHDIISDAYDKTITEKLKQYMRRE